MKTSALILTVIVLNSICAFAEPNYTLKVLFPDKEKKEYAITKAKFKLPLKSKYWTCLIEPSEKLDDGTFVREIICNDHVDRYISSVLACSPSLGEQQVVITVGEKTQHHTVDLRCR